MIENKELKQLFAAVEDNDWSIEVEGKNEYRLGKYSPAGQDFSIVIEGETVEEIINSVYEAYENFDVSEQTYIWLDDTGHGTNGAPYELRDVLEDMEACKQMLIDLYNAVK